MQTALRPPDRRGGRVLGWAEEAAAKSELLRNVGAAAASRSEPLDAACAPGEGHDEYRAGEGAQLCREARQASTRPVEQCRRCGAAAPATSGQRPKVGLCYITGGAGAQSLQAWRGAGLAWGGSGSACCHGRERTSRAVAACSGSMLSVSPPRCGGAVEGGQAQLEGVVEPACAAAAVQRGWCLGCTACVKPGLDATP